MALLDGILGGAQSAQAFGQQRFQNNLAQDKFDEQKRQYDQSYNENVRQFDESVNQFNINDVYNSDSNSRANATAKATTDKEGREALTRSNDKIYDTFKVGGYVAKDGMSLNYDKINTDLAAGDGNAEQIILGFATQFGNLPEGSKATAVQPLEGGGYAITVQNADGTQGVVTEDGESNPDSNVLRFEPGQLGKLANTNFQREILTNTSRFNATTMRNNLDMVDADSAQQLLNDLRYEQSVVAALPPEPGARRAAEAAIQSGGQETVKMIGNDLGVPKPGAPDDSESTSEVTSTIAPFDMKNVDRSTKAGRLILSIEGNVASNPRAQAPKEWMQKRQRPKLDAYREDLVNSIAATEKNRASLKNFTAPSPEKDGLLKSKAELAMVDAYLEKDKPAVFTQAAETDAVAEQAAGKTTEEIAAGVNDGTIKVDQPTVQRVAQELQAAGIKEIRDLKRLTAKDAAIARAAIIASTDNPTIAARMTQEMVNIFDNVENSPSVNRKDELGLADKSADRTYKYNSLRTDMAKTRRSWNDAANKEASDVLAGAQDIFFGPERDEENFDYDSAAQFLRSKPFNKFNIWLKQSDRTAEEIDNAMPGMNATLSLTIAAMAGEESGGRGITGRIRESVIDFISRDEVEDAVDPADFDASRLRVDDPGVDKNGKSKATKIYYTDEDGNILDEEGGLQALKNLQPEMYANALSIGIYNTRKATGE
tara:strand:- start:247 stop:2379 length:2133 start_codon:yes stop_codon:yes gene_type:complete